MSWGKKITVLYIGFVILIVSLVLISFNNKSELVAKDYYAQELNYQERINAQENEKKLDVSIGYEILPEAIVLSYPLTEQDESFSGELLFFRPSDSSKDVKLKLNFNAEGKQVISSSVFTKGVYKMCISWKTIKGSFYKEEIITI